jgi:hypothetical protein
MKPKDSRGVANKLVTRFMRGSQRRIKHVIVKKQTSKTTTPSLGGEF